MEETKVNLTNKVVLDLDKYVELLDEKNDLKKEIEKYKDKYESIIKYLFSECEVKEYASGKKFLQYDRYNNHLTDYLKEIEPEKYQKKIDEYEGEE